MWQPQFSDDTSAEGETRLALSRNRVSHKYHSSGSCYGKKNSAQSRQSDLRVRNKGELIGVVAKEWPKMGESALQVGVYDDTNRRHRP